MQTLDFLPTKLMRRVIMAVMMKERSKKRRKMPRKLVGDILLTV
jgi:hypothetical protein